MPDSLLSVSAALKQLMDRFQPAATEEIPLSEAGGRVLARPVIADIDLPPFDNASMDGFAVRATETQTASAAMPVTLQVCVDIPAGQVVDTQVGPGQAARIMTGARLPDGVDSVAPVEITDFNERQAGVAAPETVQIYQPVQSGENVRPQGQDVRRGETVMLPQQLLRPQDLGFLSMMGFSKVIVHQKPRVAIFSTGDELLPVDQPLTPGKIHDSNSYTLTALISGSGGVPVNLGIIPDKLDAVEDALDHAVASGVDLIISSAGVSVGAFDFVRNVVEARGSLDFWRVNMRPGKPLAFGQYQGVPFIGLPGNPVSAFVTFEVFVRPVLSKMAGLSSNRRPEVQALLDESIGSDGRESYFRAILHEDSGTFHARLTGHQGSGNLRSLVQANALIIIPSGVKTLPAGSPVKAWLLGDIYQR